MFIENNDGLGYSFLLSLYFRLYRIVNDCISFSFQSLYQLFDLLSIIEQRIPLHSLGSLCIELLKLLRTDTVIGADIIRQQDFILSPILGEEALYPFDDGLMAILRLFEYVLMFLIVISQEEVFSLVGTHVFEVGLALVAVDVESFRAVDVWDQG